MQEEILKKLLIFLSMKKKRFRDDYIIVFIYKQGMITCVFPLKWEIKW